MFEAVKNISSNFVLEISVSKMIVDLGDNGNSRSMLGSIPHITAFALARDLGIHNSTTGQRIKHLEMFYLKYGRTFSPM